MRSSSRRRTQPPPLRLLKLERRERFALCPLFVREIVFVQSCIERSKAPCPLFKALRRVVCEQVADLYGNPLKPINACGLSNKPRDMNARRALEGLSDLSERLPRLENAAP